MDNNLRSIYDAAVQARPIIEQLPPGLREYAQQFEALCLEDMQAQQAAATRPHPDAAQKFYTALAPLVVDLVTAWLRRYWPAVTTSIVSTALGYLAALLQK